MAQNLTSNQPNYIKIRMTNCKTCQNTRLRTLTGMSYLNLTRFLDVKIFLGSLHEHTYTDLHRKSKGLPEFVGQLSKLTRPPPSSHAMLSGFIGISRKQFFNFQFCFSKSPFFITFLRYKRWWTCQFELFLRHLLTCRVLTRFFKWSQFTSKFNQARGVIY